MAAASSQVALPQQPPVAASFQGALLPQQPPAFFQVALSQQPPASFQVTLLPQQLSFPQQPPASFQVTLLPQQPSFPQQPPAPFQVPLLPQQSPASFQVALPQQPPASFQVTLPQQQSFPQQPLASFQVALPQQLPALPQQLSFPQQPPASFEVALPQQQPDDEDDVAVDFSKYLSLHKAILAENWEEAQIFFNQEPAAIQSPLHKLLVTALHVAAKAGNASFTEKLVALLKDHELGPRDAVGDTPLHFAARYGNIEVADILVRTNSNLLYIHNNIGLFPIHYAVVNSYSKSKEVFLYFLRHTRHDEYGQPNPYAGPNGVAMLCKLIEYKFYDLALRLVERYPDLGLHRNLGINNLSALEAIVFCDCSIINKHSLNFWQSFIYYCISKAKSRTSAPTFHLIASLLQWLVGKSIVKKMVLHHQALKLLKCLCDQLQNERQVLSLAINAYFEATSLDIWQVILNITEANPLSVYLRNHMDHNILHVAVMNRSENVFKLVCGTSVLRINLPDFIDINHNSVLHLAGKLAPPHKRNLVSGAALQMQRELQWFKEVKKITPSHFLSVRNKDGKTPSMVFTEEHEKLKEAGEKWMKDTANSCTIAAALIVTVVFAAAITVPGGNSGQNGLPIFSNKNAFTIFAISNAVSLFTSATSLLVFLSILTSRFAEEDFLYALPKRLIIGLFTLFFSIIFMMIAFSATVYLVFGNNRRGVLIIVAAFACLPITSFVLLQFPLLVALVSSTYGRGIFDQRGFPQLPY